MSRRGDLIIVSAPGDYGKPRPAIVIQSDWVTATESILVALLTSEIVDAPIYRLDIEPSEANGLKGPSQVMVDKIIALPRKKCSQVIGRIDDEGIGRAQQHARSDRRHRRSRQREGALSTETFRVETNCNMKNAALADPAFR